jgi:hypothetical protein
MTTAHYSGVLVGAALVANYLLISDARSPDGKPGAVREMR